MTSVDKILSFLADGPLSIIDNTYALGSYIPIDLSVNNIELATYDVTDPVQCQTFINAQLLKFKAQIAFGGYLEERNLYKNSPNFGQVGVEKRNIHLGLDIWAPENTDVLAPLEGRIHSFEDNTGPGDYGPAIILEHHTDKLVFYTLYGHLSRKSLVGLSRNGLIQKGESFASLGNASENGNYAPHLHFQIILDLGEYRGDYPGVCSRSSLNYYRSNCPDPNLLLKITP